jgi:UDPglucose 6-dehydrogenase
MGATVGVVGLGKLGLPVAVTMAMRGYEVLGYDRDPARMTLSALAAHERGPDGTGSLASCVDDSLPLRFTGLAELLGAADCVLVAVETPHGPLYEGITPLPNSRSDFGYDALVNAVGDVVRQAPRAMEIGIVSTVLPGTIRTRIVPLTAGHTLVYCPQFVGMGTVAADLCDPEFTLLGCDDPPATVIPEVLCKLGDAPVFRVSYETAELAKVVYNTFVSAKVTLANVVQRMSHEVGADAGDVLAVIRSADRRLISDAYLAPGMADGGPCHPRDNIALSWLARRHGGGADIFSAVMETRQAYVEWLGSRLLDLAAGRPVVVLGTAFKPGTDLQTGSSTVLLLNLLRLRDVRPTVVATPADLDSQPPVADAAAFFLGCPEPQFVGYPFPAGSVVVDPWHVVQGRDGVDVMWIGAASGK